MTLFNKTGQYFEFWNVTTAIPSWISPTLICYCFPSEPFPSVPGPVLLAAPGAPRLGRHEPEAELSDPGQPRPGLPRPQPRPHHQARVRHDPGRLRPAAGRHEETGPGWFSQGN